MNKKAILYLFTFAIFLITSINRSLYGQMAVNPIIYADVPDPDVIRVGDTYYMTSTTMYFNPGIPIMKSKDLVNWSLVNYCYPVLASTDALNLNNGLEAYSGGTWASSINYKNGTYYVSSFSYSTGRTYIYITTNIETGPWTTITLNKVYHDHSLFFDDDGKVYLAYGHDDIWLTEMRPDLTGEQPGGINRIIIPKASSVAGTSFILTAEGTRLQKINSMYYVSNICWPSGRGRTQIIHRSNTIAGTYTGRVAFQSSIGSAQGEYIDTPDGKWYAMFFHDNGSVGRIPDLMPVTWSSGWPTVGVNGQVPATLDIPKGSGSIRGIIDSDEFSLAPPLKLQWQWNHNPNNTYWSLTQRSGYLRLTNERTDANVLRTTNTLTQRTYGPKCSGYVSIDVAGMKDGDYAGLLALQNKYGFVGIKMNGTSKTIVMVNGTGFSGTPTEVGNVPLNQNTVYLRIDFDFTNRTDKASFYYSLNGTSWTAIGSTLQMVYDLEHFTGYRFGLFSYATKSSGGYADFNFFRVGANITEAQNSGTTNIPPTVNITSPANNATFTSPASITINASAADADGTVSNVQFYSGATLLGSDATSPYSFTWSNVAAGTYALTARATDNAGAVTTSSAITVTVSNPVVQTPFGGTPSPIPGTIQAENYDLGGQGIAFNETTAGNSGNAYRTDNVDVETTGDVGGGYNVGWIETGEWLEYTVNVTTSGLYNLQARVASPNSGGILHVEMDGVNISGTISVPNTGGWQTYQSVTISNISLTAGQKVMRISMDAGWFNVNYISFAEVNTPPTVSISSPLNNAAFTAPASITINVNAIDSDGTISNVQFYSGATLLGSDATAPYSFTWSNVAAGTYTLTARATDNAGTTTTSSVVTVTVSNPVTQSPYGGTAAPIPGTIQAENYDLGGPGVAFNETTSGNSGNAYRTDDVDVEATGDTGGGYNVGWIAAGEWLEYTVNVTATGLYNLEARVASPNTGRTLHIEMDGVNISGPIAVPNTGAWQIFQSVSINNISLTAGQKVMRIVMDTDQLNVNYVAFTSACTPTVITPYVQINEGVWAQTTNAGLNAGENVMFGPQPISGGLWQWTGPNGFTATTREILLTNVQSGHAGNYIATYTNSAGCNSTSIFILTVTIPVASSTIQCETACSVEGTLNETFNTGFRGTGYVNTVDAAGAAASWEINSQTAQSISLGIRYATATVAGRPMSLSVNGTTQVSNIAFANTGGMTSWVVTTVQINLFAGSNTIRLISLTDEGSPYLDELVFGTGTVASESCASADMALSDADASVELSILPNPSEDAFNLTVQEQVETLVIVDGQGVVVYKGNAIAQGESIRIGEQLRAGIYMLIIQYSDGRTESRKIQKLD